MYSKREKLSVWTDQLFLSGSSQKRQIECFKKGPETWLEPLRIFDPIKTEKKQDDEWNHHPDEFDHSGWFSDLL